MNTQAIQAAAEMINPHIHGDRDFEDLTSAEQETVRSIARDATDAARPFFEVELREQIAAEIMAAPELKSRAYDPYDEGAQDAMEYAARIAEGKQ